VYHYPQGWFPSEAPFAPRVGRRSEDDGYVITLATHIGDYQSEAWIFHAQRIAAGPIARVTLPARVPAGFHASWYTGEELWGAQAAAAA
jgi:carotenoid cleavage dioxygenase